MIHQVILQIQCNGRGTYNITREVERVVSDSDINTGLCHVFSHHTSASLTLCENADPAVRRDLEQFMERLVPDGDPAYEHSLEGPDDMPAHIRSILTNMDLTLPVTAGRCARGTWQGIYLWEHRTAPLRRQITVTLQGE
ncbi:MULTISPECIES: secondary thiamine-phosphate synthase enzyme YjbQ [Sedimenticola]|uniref:Secondary thiamine-phosphate synthase n=1 Tax=Sedimenticola selenatireducens TaxID=191960 RepID=A0A2N6CZD7_9GAMM|nr:MULTISPECIES: secondary thiamine-phosphate synthase enzyme YjbQ [Sedimenticola]MCW8904044.1 secondary thiamine-phosphate synthase enzyme YjbQ [Sedimenticola sp.]PLX62747.1 MAG: secondary thiamine-phosphate synthase [Sedimenticola selenatireducens]